VCQKFEFSMVTRTSIDLLDCISAKYRNKLYSLNAPMLWIGMALGNQLLCNVE